MTVVLAGQSLVLRRRRLAEGLGLGGQSQDLEGLEEDGGKLRETGDAGGALEGLREAGDKLGEPGGS